MRRYLPTAADLPRLASMTALRHNGSTCAGRLFESGNELAHCLDRGLSSGFDLFEHVVGQLCRSLYDGLLWASVAGGRGEARLSPTSSVVVP